MMDQQVTGAIKFMFFRKIPEISLFNNLGNIRPQKRFYLVLSVLFSYFGNSKIAEKYTEHRMSV
jgi:hypothetical protein